MNKSSQELPVITLKKVFHRLQNQIFVFFSYYEPFIAKLRKSPHFKWSQTQKGWYTMYNSKSVALVKNLFPEADIKIDAAITKSVQHIPLTKHKVHTKNKELLSLFSKYLNGQGYPKITIQSYTSTMTDFIYYFPNKPIIELTQKDVSFFIKEGFNHKTAVNNWEREFKTALKLFKLFYPECKF